MANVAARDADIGQIAIAHRGKLIIGLTHRATLGALVTDRVTQDTQLWHQTRNRAGGICGCIAHLDFLFHGYAVAYPPQTVGMIVCLGRHAQGIAKLTCDSAMGCCTKQAYDLAFCRSGPRRDIFAA